MNGSFCIQVHLSQETLRLLSVLSIVSYGRVGMQITHVLLSFFL